MMSLMIDLFDLFFYRGACRILTGPCIEEGQSSSVLSWGLLLGLALIQKGLSVCHAGQNASGFCELLLRGSYPLERWGKSQGDPSLQTFLGLLR